MVGMQVASQGTQNVIAKANSYGTRVARTTAHLILRFSPITPAGVPVTAAVTAAMR
jgi:hypothetical protein